MNQTLFVSLVVVAAELFVAAQCQAGCGHLFQHKVVVQQVVAVPQVLYFAGQATHDEALLRKAIRAELQLAMQQMQLQQPPIQQQNANATGSVLQAKCAKCHSGEAAKGGVRLDGFVDDATFRRSIEIISGINVPEAMKAVIGGLQAGEHGAIMEEMLKRQPAKQAPPMPMPADPFEQPSVPGVLR